jgi:uncharacterized protein YndB with AHSA1/START domain
VAEPFETEVGIDASPDEVFRHLVDPHAMMQWMGQHAVLEAYPGGRFEIDVNGVPVRGRYVAVERPRRVIVTWGMAGSDDLPPGSTEVEFTLLADGEGTRLRLVHRNLPDSQAPQHAVGWAHFLPRLVISASGGDPGADVWEEQ